MSIKHECLTGRANQCALNLVLWCKCLNGDVYGLLFFPQMTMANLPTFLRQIVFGPHQYQQRHFPIRTPHQDYATFLSFRYHRKNKRGNLNNKLRLFSNHHL
jgi:hypothetical protein